MTHTIKSRVAGIPCIIKITSDAYSPAYVEGAPDRCYPSEGGVAEYEVCDRRGRRALWLEKKTSPQEMNAIISHYLGGDRCD